MILYLKPKFAILSCCWLNKMQKEFLVERYVERFVRVNRYRLLNLINSYLLLIPIIVPFVSSQQFSSIVEMVGFKLHAMTRTISCVHTYKRTFNNASWHCTLIFFRFYVEFTISQLSPIIQLLGWHGSEGEIFSPGVNHILRGQDPSNHHTINCFYTNNTGFNLIQRKTKYYALNILYKTRSSDVL